MFDDDGLRTETLGTDELQLMSDELEAGTLIAGRYEIREPLGSGGYAVVYRAWDREIRGDVAMKVLRRERNSAAAFARFRREVSVARDVTSLRLVRVYDLGVSDGTSFITMEIVPGGSLRRVIQPGGMAVTEAVRIATQMLEGLRALHALSIVHRDVKPENILRDANGDVKLADFGLARYLDEEHSRTTLSDAVIGTSSYLSPEQALGAEADERTDLYAVGLLLFEMLTGTKPWRSVLSRLHAPAPAVRSIRRDVPLWLSSIVARLLQRDPAARYANAEEVLAALRSRRAELRHAVSWRRVVLGVAASSALAAIVIVLRLFVLAHDSGLKFSRISMVDDDTIVAIGTKGETLWRKEHIEAFAARHAALVRLNPNAPPLLAIVLQKSFAYRPADRQTLSFLDPDTGDIKNEIRLPSGANNFPTYSDRYYASGVNAVDLDRDGVDEIVVTYSHMPEAPSYIVLYEPRIDRARVVFTAMGGHNYYGVADVDGDGKPDLLVYGINNDFDWINAAAAVRIVPWIGDTSTQGMSTLSSPEQSGLHDQDRLWYALLPRGAGPRDGIGVSFDPATKRVSVVYQNGRRVILRDGFRIDEPSPVPPSQRQAFRNSAYAHYREANRLFAAAFADSALQEISGAVDDAIKASDSVLVEAMQRARGKYLILAGHTKEGEALMRSVAEKSENASEVAYDTAVAFHLHGDLERAVTWYEIGYGRGAELHYGKSKHEFIQGIVLALTERSDFVRAEEALRRFRKSYLWADDNWESMYGEFVRWRAGEMPKFDDLIVGPRSVDLARYWKLEFRNRHGDNAAAILTDVEAEIAEGSAPRAALISLKAELLERLGRHAEAAENARRAWELSKANRSSSIVERGHVPVVAERLKRLVGMEAR